MNIGVNLTSWKGFLAPNLVPEPCTEGKTREPLKVRAWARVASVGLILDQEPLKDASVFPNTSPATTGCLLEGIGLLTY